MGESERLSQELFQLRKEFEDYKDKQDKYLKIVPLYHCPYCFNKVEEFERTGDLVFFKCTNPSCNLYDKNNYYTQEYINFVNDIICHQQNGP